MNMDHKMILIKGEDKTYDIFDYKYVNGTYEIKFTSSEKVYSYGYNNVKIYRYSGEIDANKYIIKNNTGVIFENINKILSFECNGNIRFRIFYKNDIVRSYDKDLLIMEENIANIPQIKSYLDYCKRIAEYVGLRTEDEKIYWFRGFVK